MGVLGKISKTIGKVFGKKNDSSNNTIGKIKSPDKTKKGIYANLNDDEKLGLHTASQAYEPPDKRKDFGDYKYKKDDSDKNTAVYHNDKLNKSYIGYRGTADIADVKLDVSNKDGNIVAGTQRNSATYKKRLDKHKAISKKYGNLAGVSGHSLGGNISDYVARETGAKAQVFNTGRGVDGEALADKALCMLPKGMGRPAYCDKITRHRISGDPLSVADKFISYGKTKTYNNPSSIAKAHSLDNFYK